MGQLLTLLRPDGASGLSVDVAVDFESLSCRQICAETSLMPVDAQPTAEEQSLYTSVQETLRDAKLLTDKLRCYSGCGEQIRKVRRLTVD